jgi:hypothetical protein
MSAPTPSSPTIHEATRTFDGSGVVYWGPEIDFDVAVAQRQLEFDVVVRGQDIAVNRVLAQRIEEAVGPYARGTPHLSSAGPQALPHFQQASPPPDGHTFYETPHRKARKRP